MFSDIVPLVLGDTLDVFHSFQLKSACSALLWEEKKTVEKETIYAFSIFFKIEENMESL